MKTDVNTTSGSDSIDNRSGSVGSDSGTRDNGSAGNVDGSGRNVDGSGGSADGSADRNDDSGNFGGQSGDSSAEQTANDIGSNVESVDGDSGATRGSRNDRQRGRRPIRLGDFGNRDTDPADRTSADDGNEQARIFDEPVIRLGARKQGRPKTKVDTESTIGEIKISETKALISMFLGSIFEVPAVTLKQDFWRLSNEENKLLTEAIVEWLKSMPKSRSSKIAQFITEHLPIVNLAMIAFFIISDRVKGSIAIAQVTKAGKAFDVAGNEPRPTQQGATIQTPLDAMFS